jgi:hypothetical protein
MVTYKNKVIHIKNKYYEMVSYFFGIGIGAIMTSRKVNVKMKFSNFSIPRPRSLLKTIERFIKVKKYD